ncbi:hypothetical protein [Amazonocrinis nigriterrae]|uniref:hypothetical protein n=1 Tax=Amazonocrinis nigriterrae TaxID=2840443 RepID=UPI001CEC9A8C|nr:hypothetical protein [Amazonocrinis nigriterrae]
MNMKKVAFEPEAFDQLGLWATEDKKIYLTKNVCTPLQPTPVTKHGYNQNINSKLVTNG